LLRREGLLEEVTGPHTIVEQLIYSRTVLYGITIVTTATAHLKVTDPLTLSLLLLNDYLPALKYFWMMQYFQNLRLRDLSWTLHIVLHVKNVMEVFYSLAGG
jgi:hypothetical protein